MSNAKEKWIPGYEKLYSADTDGNIYSYLSGERVKLKPTPCGINGRKYFTVRISDGPKKGGMYIHRLVALAFIPNPDNKRTVNHKNGIKSDNSLNNLEWHTHGENHKHAYRELGRKKHLKGKTGSLCMNSIAIIQMDENFNLIKEFSGGWEAERETGIPQQNISKVVNGKRQRAGGYRWKFKHISNNE